MSNPIFAMKTPLYDAAERYEKEAELATNKFNQGYFEGKAEMARTAISCLGVSNERLITDIINGDV